MCREGGVSKCRGSRFQDQAQNTPKYNNIPTGRYIVLQKINIGAVIIVTGQVWSTGYMSECNSYYTCIYNTYMYIHASYNHLLYLSIYLRLCTLYPNTDIRLKTKKITINRVHEYITRWTFYLLHSPLSCFGRGYEHYRTNKRGTRCVLKARKGTLCTPKVSPIIFWRVHEYYRTGF